MAKKSKKEKPSKKVVEQDPPSDNDAVDDAAEESFSDDDQTAAFLKGFESDGDEDDAQKEGGLAAGRDVPHVPTLSNKQKKRLKRLAESSELEKSAVVYVGRIPHGFYEQEMKAYFEQFGKIIRLRLSRNRRTGESKHHAWIEFESATVAEIVAKTMDSYLLFNHILKVKVVPDEQIPANLFKGCNRRFKKVPWNKMEGRKLAQGATEEVWEKRTAKEQKRRQDKADKLKAIGYEFDAPALKSAKGLAQKASPAQALESAPEEMKLLEDAAPAPPAAKKSKKKGKSILGTAEPKDTLENVPDVTEDDDVQQDKDVAVEDVQAGEMKPKKKKKVTKVAVVEAEVVQQENGAVKKTKKFKKTEIIA